MVSSRNVFVVATFFIAMHIYPVAKLFKFTNKLSERANVGWGWRLYR